MASVLLPLRSLLQAFFLDSSLIYEIIRGFVFWKILKFMNIYLIGSQFP